MKIEHGSVEYFALIRLRDQLGDRNYRKLDLINLDTLRYEINNKIEAINEEFRERKQQGQK